MVVMPMARHNKTDRFFRIHAEKFEIMERSRTPGNWIKAGIHYSPVTVSKMHDYAFTKTRAKDRNFQLL